jgi:hypothetical protein
LKSFTLTALLTLVLVTSLAGCERRHKPLQLSDLTQGERLYIERFMVLERVRAIALVDADRGAALADSLAAAWGDSSMQEVQRGVSAEPARAAAVHDLLLRILEAERDSLLQVPAPRRLTAALPDLPATAPNPAE